MHWPLLVLALPAAALSAQTVFSPTLVDALSADPDYTDLITLLQRARLIPTLNKLNGSTFFAPTNHAIRKHRLWHDMLQADDLNDNIKEQLRQQLFYHLINYTLPEFPDTPQPQVLVLETLHYPRTPLEPPSKEPPPSPPWMPIPGGSLGSQPQRLRIAARDEGARVGVDAFGKAGVEIVKGVIDAGNGLLLGIDDVLEPPPDLGASLCVWLSHAYLTCAIQPVSSRSILPSPTSTKF